MKAKSLLAGGLRLDNLEAALRVGTAGVDLNSGLETAPGRKDSGLINQAFKLIKEFK